MEGEAASISEAASNAAAAVEEAAAIADENASAALAGVIADAEQRVAAANDAAAEIARSALETELGRRQTALEGRIEECLAGQNRLSSSLEILTAELSETRAQLAATATVAVAAASGPVPPLISEPLEPSSTVEAAEELAAVIPEAMVPAPVASTPSAQVRGRQKVFL